jgi:hypothetical protein
MSVESTGGIAMADTLKSLSRLWGMDLKARSFTPKKTRNALNGVRGAKATPDWAAETCLQARPVMSKVSTALAARNS